jgi:hypothetical protein
VDPSFAGLDGHSHFPIFNADSVDFDFDPKTMKKPNTLKLGGSYRYVYTMVDRTGNGWAISAHFSIGP